MPDIAYGAAAIEAARSATAAEARRVPALADALPPVDPGVLGPLAPGPLADAIEHVRTRLTADLTAAGVRLDGLDRALDATWSSVHATDRGTAAALGSSVSRR